MIPIQIIGIGMALLTIYASYYNYKRSVFNKLDMIIWQTIWGIFLIIVIFPSSFMFLAKASGVIRLMDLLMVVGFIIIYIFTYINYINNRKINKTLNSLVRGEALSSLKSGFSK